jgi:hypothetical protein
LHQAKLVPEEIRASTEDNFMRRHRALVREEVDVEEVAPLAEIVEHARGEKGTAQATAIITSLK